MRTITSVGVLSVAKIMGAIYAVIGLILLPFFLLASLIGSMAGGHDNPLGAIGGLISSAAGRSASFDCIGCDRSQTAA